ncbi:MAG: polyprenyl synthetase family protein [Nitrospinota bacterium]|nr:polyprenyl synthetase family protein [Nitrospinota bacterium]
MPLTKYFETIAQQTETWLDQLVPQEDAYPPSIHQAMRYSLFAGGKRMRPMLAVAAFEAVSGQKAVGTERGAVMPFAAALEIIHTYTLIHDDLPALDDDELRRGKPTCHVRFGEDMAILAGDALLTLAFRILTDLQLFKGIPAQTVCDLARETAEAIGSLGTIGGQVVDLEYENTTDPDPAILEYIHTHKTGKLIAMAVRGGGMLGGAGEDQLSSLTEYGRRVGLAFQIIDDILDVEGDEKLLGKRTGSDKRMDKMTYPSVSGMKASKEKAVDLIDKAIGDLEMFAERAGPLSDLARYVAARTL